jgi:hypothetical protein
MNLIPVLSKCGQNRSVFEARMATENLKYVTQVLKGGRGEEKKCPVLAWVKVGNPNFKKYVEFVSYLTTLSTLFILYSVEY